MRESDQGLGVRGQDAAERIQVALGTTPLLARLLAARGWREVEAITEFLYPRLEHAHSPWLLLGMERAVERTLGAVAAGEPILILGDYDADGTLATVIVRQALRTLQAEVRYELSERLRGGYGLSPETMERAASAGVKLAITVDTGIREHAALERARELGIDVIVTDHHLPGDTLPAALAIVNPHQTGCGYPDKGLCGSGVAFKLAQALLERSGKLEGAWPAALQSYLKLVAIATVADAVPLLGENRIFTRFGLAGLERPVNAGLRALLGFAVMKGKVGVSSRDVAFGVAPRLNAAGRMGAADRVVELFAAPAAEAVGIAQELELANQQRQQCCAKIMAEIEARGEETGVGVLVIAGEGWHRGVLGIVASKVLERRQRAVIIVSIENGQAHGSGRAPEGVHLLELIEGCGALFDRYGGHAQAVGFSMGADKIEALRRYLEAAEVPAAKGRSEACFEVSLTELTAAACKDLRRLEPFGEGNREPVFRVRGARLVEAPQILKERHLKLVVEQDGVRHTALMWNHTEAAGLTAGAELELICRVETSTHERYGERTQLIVREYIATALAVSGGSVIA
ncbi:MAG: single-stranded-DNA-specific exonuclease RecJ [Terriglobales bacterium]